MAATYIRSAVSSVEGIELTPALTQLLVVEWPGYTASLRLYRRAFRDVLRLGVQHSFRGGTWRWLRYAAESIGLHEHAALLRAQQRVTLLKLASSPPVEAG